MEAGQPISDCIPLRWRLNQPEQRQLIRDALAQDPDSEFTHIAINPNTQNGIVEWLEPVTDEEYNNL